MRYTVARPLLLRHHDDAHRDPPTMIAETRPSRPEHAASSLRHLWGVVLPGTERPRGIVLSRRHYTGRRAREGELARPLERATRLIPPARLVTVLTRETAAGAGPVLAAVPGLQHCLQPASR